MTTSGGARLNVPAEPRTHNRDRRPDVTDSARMEAQFESPDPPPNSRGKDWLDLAALIDPARVIGTRPVRSDEAWQALYRFATAHLVAPSLYANLAASNRLQWLPGPMAEALAVLHELNDARNRRLQRILLETIRVLNSAGIEPIALKGAIALLPDQYPTAFARYMGDLDLAIHPDQESTALSALTDAGYHMPRDVNWVVWERSHEDHHHAPGLADPTDEVCVELHRSVLGFRIPAAVLPPHEVEAAASRVDWEGARLRIPSLAHRLMHNSLHHQVADRAFESDRRSFRQLLEFAQLRVLDDAAALDWPSLLAALDRAGVGDALRLDLLATGYLFGLPMPPGTRPTEAVLVAESRFWLRNCDADFDRALLRKGRRAEILGRLRRLPARLITPDWYRRKIGYLRRRWAQRRLRQVP